ncbi:molybdopterin biosynthesis, protein C [Syntrophaceticus schinkii]|uniref:Cyclic pyranopterin monophosphate synthase n=1 Tax=Syntrophaceticus schinkii TaxID=499207 RepID=A0A0B7MIU0_9FIRM|nr:molybdopterin biosynthesis, protein C [Syntrophaceticus schinkii]
MVDDLTHFDDRGRARMVDVGAKGVTEREARARGTVFMAPETLQLIKSGGIKKGDVLAVAQVAGIMGAKRTFELIPMCHPLLLTGIDLDFHYDDEGSAVEIEARVRCQGKTGVEMEALTAVNIAALTIYDMCKAVDRAMVIGEIRLVEKSGGKSGTFFREGEQEWEKS